MNFTRGDALKFGLVAFMLLIISIHALALDSRTIHIDEGMGIRATERALSGDLSYNPKNGHGPVFFYMGALIRKWSDLDVANFRILTSASAVLSIAVLWLVYRRKLVAAGRLTLFASLGLSSGMVFFGAYFIHEMVMILFTVLALSSAEMWMRTKRGIWLTALILAFSLMVMTKETALFTGVAWILAIGAAYMFGEGRDRLRGLFVRKNILFVFYGVLASAFLYLAMFGGSLDLFRSPLFWLERGTSMHIKPWYYFLVLALLHEPLILVSGVLMAAYTTVKKAWNARLLFFFIWFFALMTIHSIVPYKTPWLLPYMLLPLALFTVFAISSSWARTDKALLSCVMAILFLFSTASLVKDNFIDPDRRSDYGYAYLQSGKGLRELISIMGAIASTRDSRVEMQIIGRADELLQVITEGYDRKKGEFEPGLPLYLNYKHSATKALDMVGGSGDAYVLLKFTYIDPLPEIDMLVREDIWNEYKLYSGFISPKEVRSDGIIRYN